MNPPPPRTSFPNVRLSLCDTQPPIRQALFQ
jgi:hypothetical protein